MAATDVVFSGLYHLAGQSVTVSVAGLDCGDFVVASDGSVTVPQNSDPDQKFNGAYLAQFDVGPLDKKTWGDATAQVTMTDGYAAHIMYIPVVIGFSYLTLGQVLRSATQAVMKTGEGNAFGTTRRNHMFGALVHNAVGVAFGTLPGNLADFPFRDAGQNILPKYTMFSGVAWGTINEASGFDGQIAWAISRPYPCTVCSLTSYLEVHER